MDNQTLGQVEDLASLPRLDEKILLEEIKARYFNDNIYTNVGDILVAVNPFKALPIYGKDESEKYKLAKSVDNPPHIFAVSDATYQAMQGLRGDLPRNQCILISGESGAGKTESTKFIIKQLIDICKGQTQLEQQILQVNPLLEAFGNAMTLMNDNSSRFGKYIQLKFKNGHVMGAKISEYLLEKSRVVRQGPGEQNFHIFYYLFAGLPPEKQKQLKLESGDHYRYFTGGKSKLPTPLLKERYEELMNAMDLVGFTEEEQQDMFSVLAGILSLGNTEFEANDDGGATPIKNSTYVNNAASLLGIEARDVTDTMTLSVQAARGDVFTRYYTKAQAEDARDAIGKQLYGRLFSWIVNKVNTILAPREILSESEQQEIGILDIFGFEHFQKNSFEQACINLANEQLQFFFNKHVFIMEQEEYKREGIDWTEIKFIDNQPLLDLFIAKPIGLLALLDEESQFPKASDASYVEKMNKHFAKNQNYIKQKGVGQLFTIAHYAGKVEYDADGWLEKNRDTIPSGLMEMLRQSKNQLISLIFKGRLTRTGTLALQSRTSKSKRTKKSSRLQAANMAKAAKERKLSVGAQFKNSLDVLMQRMTQSQPVFVRCIKPNSTKSAHSFDEKYVTAQLLYTGMLETTKIRREGYAIRPVFSDFVEKYKILIHQPSLVANKENVSQILRQAGVKGFHIGKTKVFLKHNHLDILTDKLDELQKSVLHMQRVVRGFLGRRYAARCWLEAREQSDAAEAFLTAVEGLSITTEGQLQTLIAEDSKLPEDYFDPKKPVEPPTPPPQLRNKTVSFEEEPRADAHHSHRSLLMSGFRGGVHINFDEEEGEEDDDEGGVSDSEDDFTPQPTTGATKYGPAGTKQASLRWFKETQSTKLQQPSGGFAEWFHGIITRRESEELLKDKELGCFLIRVSESRFGYSLSFKVEGRARHYMIDQTPSGKYVIIGEPKVHKSLADLVTYHQRVPISNYIGLLSVPCGQQMGQCDYAELLGDDRTYFELEENGKKARTSHVSSRYMPLRDRTSGRPNSQPRHSDVRTSNNRYTPLRPDRSSRQPQSLTGHYDVPPPLPNRTYVALRESSPIRGTLPAVPGVQEQAYQSLLKNQEEQHNVVQPSVKEEKSKKRSAFSKFLQRK